LRNPLSVEDGKHISLLPLQLSRSATRVLLFYPFVAVSFGVARQDFDAQRQTMLNKGGNCFGSGRKIDRIVRTDCQDHDPDPID
jgi:hypothetical protein